ncbi:MAG: hypothetical protein WAV20_03715 [Blastocatellia bacterium]
MADQIVTYSNIFAANYSVTGIRSENEDNTLVLMTGSCPLSGAQTQGMLYRGPMNPTDSSRCICLTPNVGKTVTSSLFYGPDTPLFNPSIQAGNVRVVGSYKYANDPLGNVDHGVLYEGPPDGKGGYWKTIDMPDDVPNGVAVANTIPHSTMGELIVGNYDLQGAEPGKFNAFIYNIHTGKYQKLKEMLGPDIELVTAYGIWQNVIGKPYYTIAGGLRHRISGLNVNVGYLVDYDSATSMTSNLTTFSYDNEPSLITHFEGISECGPNCYSLAATGDQDTANRGAAFAVVERLPDGSFGPAKWERVQATSSGITTGNTVLTNNLFGIYTTGNGIQSYVAGNLPLADVKAEG